MCLQTRQGKREFGVFAAGLPEKVFQSKKSLDKFNICEALLKDVVERLDAAGLMMRGGTIVDATIISAPSSTRNKEGRRDPEMHQTKKGNQWYHGMVVYRGIAKNMNRFFALFASANLAQGIRAGRTAEFIGA